MYDVEDVRNIIYLKKFPLLELTLNIIWN